MKGDLGLLINRKASRNEQKGGKVMEGERMREESSKSMQAFSSWYCKTQTRTLKAGEKVNS